MDVGRTPGLRVVLGRQVGSGSGFLLLFGRHGERVEEVTDAQAMTLLVELVREMGLSISGQPNDRKAQP
ncbi:hypothetical protein [Streptomyces sp. CA-111067]|uniref:hypothetical protein n=1 Tax=Streptomyces sp. CA-111067 TaxID=3240046 RepID=UPI003D9543B4